MILSIITINRNNAPGLRKTMQSVLEQTFKDFEYVVVDGASTDGSVDVIKEFAPLFGERMKWMSEPDSGIYNAMNKGIQMARGDYVEFLNSGDCLASVDVIKGVMKGLEEKEFPSILYGNMIKVFSDGHRQIDINRAGKSISFFNFYHGTLNHSSAFIRRSMFEKYGMYDESLKIVSDWKWFLNVVVLGEEKPEYVNHNVTLFDMTGISENPKNVGVITQERRQVLAALIPSSILSDYKKYYSDILMINRLRRHPIFFKIVRIIERMLFKVEKILHRRNTSRIWA